MPPGEDGPDARTVAQVEDILWLIEVDRAEAAAACRRVGTTLSAIEKACRRWRWNDEWRRISRARAWPLDQSRISQFLDGLGLTG